MHISIDGIILYPTVCWQVQDLLVASEKLHEENQSLKLQNSDQSRQIKVGTVLHLLEKQHISYVRVNISICQPPPPHFQLLANLGGPAGNWLAAAAGGFSSRGAL